MSEAMYGRENEADRRVGNRNERNVLRYTEL